MDTKYKMSYNRFVDKNDYCIMCLFIIKSCVYMCKQNIEGKYLLSRYKRAFPLINDRSMNNDGGMCST